MTRTTYDTAHMAELLERSRDAPSHYEATLDLPPYARLRWPPREATR